MSRHPVPAELRAELLRPIRDTREQQPYVFPNLGPEIVTTLDLADYSHLGGIHRCRVERKSTPDYLGSIFTDRFNRELSLIRAFECHALVVECDYAFLKTGQWRVKATANQVVGKTIGFIESGVNVIFAGSREAGQEITERLIYMSARRMWERSRELISAIVNQEAAPSEIMEAVA